MDDDTALYLLVGERLREARARTPDKVTQEGLATAVGLERSSVTNIEAGRQKAPLHVLYALARELRVELATLVPTSEELVAYKPDKEVDIGGNARVVPASVAAIVSRQS